MREKVPQLGRLELDPYPLSLHYPLGNRLFYSSHSAVLLLINRTTTWRRLFNPISTRGRLEMSMKEESLTALVLLSKYTNLSPQYDIRDS